MKKKIFILNLFLLAFLCVRVNAEQKTDFELVNEFTSTGDFTEINFVKTQKVGDDYIVAQKNIIKRVNKNGIKKWEFAVNQTNMNDLYDFIVDGEFLYVTHCSGNALFGEVEEQAESTCYVTKLKVEDGTEVKANNTIGGQHIDKIGDNLVVGSYNGTFIINKELEVVKSNEFGSVIFTVDNNKIYMIGYSSPIIQELDANLNVVKETTMDLTNCSGVSPDHINNFIKVDNNFYLSEFSVYKINSNGVCSVAYDDSTNDFYGDYYLSITKAEDYIIVGGSDYRESCTYSQTDGVLGGVSTSNGTYCEQGVISIFDKDFNYIEDLKFNNDYNGVVKNLYYENGRLLAKWVDWNNNNIGVSEYVLRYNIESKTDGNGTIEVVDSAFAGDEIVFKVNAKKGYTLKSIKVTGVVSGNTIEISAKELDTVNAETGYYSVSRNGFIMPGEDVIIEATFEKEVLNPDTGLTMTLPIIILVSLGIIMFIVEVKKTKRYI